MNARSLRAPLVVPLALVVMALAGCATSSSTTGPTEPSVSLSSAGGTSTASASPTGTVEPDEIAEGTLDHVALAEAISSNLTTNLKEGTRVEVSCPAGVALAAGATSPCTATVDGEELPFTVTQNDAVGGVDFAPAKALVDLAALTSATAEQFAGQVGGTWSATCSAGSTTPAYRVVAVGGTFDCVFEGHTADSAAPASRPFTVTVKDIAGTTDWVVK